MISPSFDGLNHYKRNVGFNNYRLVRSLRIASVLLRKTVRWSPLTAQKSMLDAFYRFLGGLNVKDAPPQISLLCVRANNDIKEKAFIFYDFLLYAQLCRFFSYKRPIPSDDNDLYKHASYASPERGGGRYRITAAERKLLDELSQKTGIRSGDMVSFILSDYLKKYENNGLSVSHLPDKTQHEKTV